MTHSVTTFRRFPSRFLRGDNAFTFHFDTNDRPARFERFVFVFWANNRLRGLVANGRREIIGAARVSRPNRRTVKVRVRKALLDRAGYHWLVASFFSGGFDVAPDQRLAFHDLTPPTIRLLSFPNPSTNASATLTLPVSFRLADESRIRSWALQWREVGETGWKAAATGRGAGTKTVPATGVEGANYVFRVRATDRAGNRRTSRTRLVSVPVDDANLDLTSAFIGDLWQALPGPSFLGGFQVTGAAEDTFEHEFMGHYVAWIAVPTPTPVTATVNVEGTETLVNLGSFVGERVKVFEQRGLDPSTLHKITISGDAAGVTVDGLVFR